MTETVSDAWLLSLPLSFVMSKFVMSQTDSSFLDPKWPNGRFGLRKNGFSLSVRSR